MTNIAVCGDQRVLLGIAVTIRSALHSATSKLNIHVIANGLTEANERDLKNSWVDHPNCGHVRFAQLRKQSVSRYRSTGYLKSKSAYGRYFISEMFPDIDLCAYLDADLLVYKDLSQLSKIDLGDNLCAAVADISTRLEPVNPELKSRLGLWNEQSYFNSGFLYFSAAAWRREKVFQKLDDISRRRFDDLHAQDQDALNIILEGRVLLLDPSWNTSQYEQPKPLDGRIVHLIGPIKPWHARYRHKYKTESYYREVILKAFRDVLDSTQYRGSRPTGFDEVAELIYDKIPTLDMLLGKMRRSFGKSLTAARYSNA